MDIELKKECSRTENQSLTGAQHGQSKLQVAMASVTPAEVLAEQHRKMAEPGTARN